MLRFSCSQQYPDSSGSFSDQTPVLIPRRQVLDHLSYGLCSRSGFLKYSQWHFCTYFIGQSKPHGLCWVKKGRTQSLFPGTAIIPLPTSHPWGKEDCDLLYHDHVMIKVMKWDGFSQMIIGFPLAVGFQDIWGSLFVWEETNIWWYIPTEYENVEQKRKVDFLEQIDNSLHPSLRMADFKLSRNEPH